MTFDIQRFKDTLKNKNFKVAHTIFSDWAYMHQKQLKKAIADSPNGDLFWDYYYANNNFDYHMNI